MHGATTEDNITNKKNACLEVKLDNESNFMSTKSAFGQVSKNLSQMQQPIYCLRP